MRIASSKPLRCVMRYSRSSSGSVICDRWRRAWPDADPPPRSCASRSSCSAVIWIAAGARFFTPNFAAMC